MKNESGKTLLEMLGYLLISSLITVASFKTYTLIKNKQTRFVIKNEIENLIDNINVLASFYDSFEDISIPYLIKSGALQTDKTLLGTNWTITGKKDFYTIFFEGLSQSDCEFFKITQLKNVTKKTSICTKKHKNLLLLIKK